MTKPKSRRPSLASVARSAGVSTAAVSLVLGGRHRDYGLSEDTATRVRSIAEAQGYQRPSRRRGPPRLHVVHLADLLRMDARGTGGAVLQPLLEALAAQGWHTTVDPHLPTAGAGLGTEVLGAAAVLIPVNIGFDEAALALARQATAAGVQTVLLGRRTPGLAAIQVDGDQEAGGRLAAEHLLGLGCRRIALIGGVAADAHTAARIAGFQAVCGRQVQATVWGDGHYTIDGAYRLTAQRLAGKDRPQAIFCCNDRMALGALLALREAGLAAPDDVALMGFDDEADFVAVAPGLTSVRIEAQGAGARLAALLEPGRPPRTAVLALPPRLVPRASTAIARKKG